jgi:hypothetical protein
VIGLTATIIATVVVGAVSVFLIKNKQKTLKR